MMKDDSRPLPAAELAWRYALMTALLVVFVGPFLWLLSVSLRGEGNIYQITFNPSDYTLNNFIEVWSKQGISRAFLNSIVVTGGIVGANLLFCSLAAYPLARLEFPGRKVIFLLMLGTLMIPFQLYMIPLFLLALKIGIWDTLIGIILPVSAQAFGIFLIKQYYETIPRDLEEAARIDGANEFDIWRLIMFPLTKPALGALGIFIFVGAWSDFLWPLVITYSESNFTLPVAIAKLSGTFVAKTQFLAAGSVIAIAPIITFFFFAQRFFIGGMTLGSVKG